MSTLEFQDTRTKMPSDHSGTVASVRSRQTLQSSSYGQNLYMTPVREQAFLRLKGAHLRSLQCDGPKAPKPFWVLYFGPNTADDINPAGANDLVLHTVLPLFLGFQYTKSSRIPISPIADLSFVLEEHDRSQTPQIPTRAPFERGPLLRGLGSLDVVEEVGAPLLWAQSTQTWGT